MDTSEFLNSQLEEEIRARQSLNLNIRADLLGRLSRQILRTEISRALDAIESTSICKKRVELIILRQRWS